MAASVMAETLLDPRFESQSRAVTAEGPSRAGLDRAGGGAENHHDRPSGSAGSAGPEGGSTMRSSSAWFVALALLATVSLAGCVISEQAGHMPQRLPGMGAGYSAAEDVTYHFESGFNWGIVLGRSALLGIVGLWLFFSVGGPVPRVIAAVLFVVAAWFLYQGLTTITGYRVVARVDGGLHVSVPPDAPVDIPYEMIETLDISGYEWMRGQTAPSFGPNASPQKLAFTELPDWRSMTIYTTDGLRVELDVERLSIEQRQGLLAAIVKYGGLVQER